MKYHSILYLHIKRFTLMVIEFGSVTGMNGSQIKAKICKKAKALGANVVRSCSVDRWREIPIQEPEFWSQNI